MLKFGSNILQAIGYFSGMQLLILFACYEFLIQGIYAFDVQLVIISSVTSGTYLIALAFMSKICLSNNPILKDYAQPFVVVGTGTHETLVIFLPLF